MANLHAEVEVLARKLSLERANKLSGTQALEIWRVMQLIAIKGSLDEVPGPVLEAAMTFNKYPEARKLVSEKALVYEHSSDTRRR